MADNELFGNSEQLDDTISRRGTIVALKSGLLDEDGVHVWRDVRNTTINAAIEVVEAMPSAQRWIPCSERLPEAYVDVLVWFEYYRYGDYNCLYQMHGIGTYIKEYDSWIINHETGWGKLRVFAWMPLPSPWKGGEE